MSEFSTQAVQAKKFLQSKGLEVSHSLMLEMFSVLEGFRDYQTRKGVTEKEQEADGSENCSPAIVPDPDGESNDFVMAPEYVGAWVRVDNQLVHLVRTDEGLVVDIFVYDFLEESIASTYSFTQEAVNRHVDYLDEQTDDTGMDRLKSLCKSAGISVEPTTDSPGWCYKVQDAQGQLLKSHYCEDWKTEREVWLVAYEEEYATNLRNFTAKALGSC